MTNNNIFLGSGTSVTLVPEVDFTFKGTPDSTRTVMTFTADYSNNFSLVNNLYEGCILEYYNQGAALNSGAGPLSSSSGASTLGSATITTAGTQVTASQASLTYSVVSNVSNFTHTNAAGTADNEPVTGMTGGSGAELLLTLSPHTVDITMTVSASDSANYQTGFIKIHTATSTGDYVFGVVFDTPSGTTNDGAGMDDFVEINISHNQTAIQVATAIQAAMTTKINSGDLALTVIRAGAKLSIANTVGGFVNSGNMIVMADSGGEVTDFGTISNDVDGGIVSAVSITNVGSSIEGAGNLTITSAGTDPIIALATASVADVVTAPTSIHRITSNTHNSFTISPAMATNLDASDFLILKRYGAPLPAPKNGTVKRLAADNWLGIVDSLTFPENEIETKQQNLFVGGSRNYTYAYRGIETAGAADVGVVANHGAWLYYFFGNAKVEATLTASANPDSDILADTANTFYLNPDRNDITKNHQAPLFYRSIGTVMTPPVAGMDDAHVDLDKLDPPVLSGTALSKAITYTFTEEDGDNLPSFALEQSFSKLPSTNPYRTETSAASETLNFVRIARGLRVNTLTLTANENEELKMSMNMMCRNLHTLEQTESYEARRGVADETSFINYSSVDSFREPFFFSDGAINMFGQQLLKITNFTLTMNNTLTDKRFVGMGSRKVKDAIPAQRTYEMTFTAMVTDNRMYEELLNTSETSGSEITLAFTKGNGEKINLAFDKYFLTSNSWPMPEDKGPIMVEGTIQARSIGTCTALTHWILQG